MWFSQLPWILPALGLWKSFIIAKRTADFYLIEVQSKQQFSSMDCLSNVGIPHICSMNVCVVYFATIGTGHGRWCISKTCYFVF